MPAALFVQNPAGIAAMAAGPGMLGAMHQCGEFVRVDCESFAPVDTGAYAYGTPGKPGVTGGGFKVDAAVRGGVATVRISNDVKHHGHCYAVDVEFGNSDSPAQHVMGRGLSALSSHL